LTSSTSRSLACCQKKEFAQPGGQGQDEALQRSSRKLYFDWDALFEMIWFEMSCPYAATAMNSPPPVQSQPKLQPRLRKRF
jgi:hypothetical protein